MKKFIVLVCLITMVGCSSKPLNAEETIRKYYDYLLDGDMEKATNLLNWDSNEGDIIDYFADIDALSKQHKLASYEGLKIISMNSTDEKLANAKVKLIYLDESNQKIEQNNELTLELDSNKKWKITSIKHEQSE